LKFWPFSRPKQPSLPEDDEVFGDDEVLTIIGSSHPFAGLAEQMLDAGWSRDMVVWVLDRLEAERAAVAERKPNEVTLVGEPRLGLSKQGATAPVVVPLVPVPDDPGPEP
jgi:hypothetical protein